MTFFYSVVKDGTRLSFAIKSQMLFLDKTPFWEESPRILAILTCASNFWKFMLHICAQDRVITFSFEVKDSRHLFLQTFFLKKGSSTGSSSSPNSKAICLCRFFSPYRGWLLDSSVSSDESNNKKVAKEGLKVLKFVPTRMPSNKYLFRDKIYNTHMKCVEVFIAGFIKTCTKYVLSLAQKLFSFVCPFRKSCKLVDWRFQ